MYVTTVIAGFDGSDHSRQAVRWAAREATAQGAALLVVHSYERVTPYIAPGDPIRTYLSEELDAVREECVRSYPELKLETQLLDGPPEHTLAALTDETSPDLLVLGSSGLGAVARAVLGSTAAELAHKVTVPLVVVRGERPEAADGPVVAGLDGSAAGDHAVDFALAFAARHNARVRVVHALATVPILPGAPLLKEQADPEATDEVINLRLDKLREPYPDVDVEAEVVPDRPADALMERASGARLLVVGSHGASLVERILVGSTSHAVLYHAPCPVALIRPPTPDEQP